VEYWIDDGIWFFDPAGTLQQPTDPPAHFGTTPAWSPDGTQMALALRAPGMPDYDIYTVDRAGGNLVRLTHEPGDDASPSWSPDGSRIAFVSHRDANAEIYIMDRNGSNPTRVTDNIAKDTLPAWRP
jgi:TolB protein